MVPSSKPDSGLVFSGAVMSQPTYRPSKPRGGASPGAKPGNPTPPHIQMELKQRILVALSRLADRDTQQIAVEELDKLVETISPDCVSVFLSCLYDSEMQQKSVVKKECVRLFSSLASLHGELLVPHLTKIIASIMRRLRDPDSSVRDGCVESIASLSARMLCPPSSSSSGLEKENSLQNGSALTLATFSKPLFDALSEQNKSVQTGAALCLARVIENAKSLPLLALARLCPRICKFMSNPNFLARPALLGVIGSLSQVGALNQQQLALVVPCMHEALESTDWATRKAAAETLGRVGGNLGPALSSFRSTTLQVLETSRFDKVKPVRDSINDATQVWKNLPGTESETYGSTNKADGDELAVAVQRLELRNLNLSCKATSYTAAKSVVIENKSENSPNRLVKSLEKPLEAVKKRVPLLTDKKLNPEFFQKMAAKGSDEWQIEVAVPRSCPPSNPQVLEVGVKEGHGEVKGTLIHGEVKGTLIRSSSETEHVSLNKNRSIQDSLALPSGRDLEPASPESSPLVADDNPLSRTHGFGSSIRKNKNIVKMGPEGDGHKLNSSSTVTNQAMNERSNWHFIHKQLTQLEHQQANLLQMVQDIMVSSKENISVLKARIWDLENVVESLVCDVGFSGTKNSFKLAAGGHENSGLKLLGRYTPGSEYGNSRYNKKADNFRSLADMVCSSDNTNKAWCSVHKLAETTFDDWDEFAHRAGHAGAQGLDVQAAGRRLKDLPNIERVDPGYRRRLWNRLPGPVRLGEGPSARSVWQASKDEATLAAIRVAGDEDSELSEIETHPHAASRVATPDSGSNMPRRKAGNGEEKGNGQFWSLWGSAMEFVQAGDVESAYTQVLCAEDQRMLARLMSRTGPVLDQFTITTATEVLHAVGLLLQQQKYFGFCLCWIQQVADMVASNGPECLDLSLDSKKELLMALQETSGMELPEGWLGSSVDELLQQLALAWSIDIETGEMDS